MIKKYLTIIFSIFVSTAAFSDGGGGAIIPGNDLHAIEDLVLLSGAEYDDLLLASGDEVISSIGGQLLMEPLISNGQFKDKKSGVRYISTFDAGGNIYEFIQYQELESILMVHEVDSAFAAFEQLLVLEDFLP